MSPVVGNFVHDLVEMAKAMETLPQIEEQARQLQAKLDEAQRHNAGLEENIIGYKQKIDDLQAKVRSLEVERDDASFRTLELEDTIHKANGDLEAIQALVSHLSTAFNPPKPEPEPVKDTAAENIAAQPTDAPQSQSEDPLSKSQVSDGSANSGAAVSSPQVDTSTKQGEIGTSNSESQHELIHPTSPSHDYDPEPLPKWSYEWYQWNDRRNERDAKQASAF